MGTGADDAWYRCVTQAGVQLRGLENAVHSEIPPDMPW